MEPRQEQDFEAVTVTVPTIAATTLIVGRAVWVYGFSLREASGAAAADIDVIAGGDGNGDTLATVTLGANESVRDSLPHRGIYSSDGVTIKVNAGSVRGAVWVCYAGAGGRL